MSGTNAENQLRLGNSELNRCILLLEEKFQEKKIKANAKNRKKQAHTKGEAEANKDKMKSI